MSSTPSESSGKSTPQRRAKAQKRTPEIRIRVSWCKGCGLCVDYCKSGVLVMEGVVPKVVDAQRCTWCLQCEAICPDFAIEVCEAETPKAADRIEGRGNAGVGVLTPETAGTPTKGQSPGGPEEADAAQEGTDRQDRPALSHTPSAPAAGGSGKPNRGRA